MRRQPRQQPEGTFDHVTWVRVLVMGAKLRPRRDVPQDNVRIVPPSGRHVADSRLARVEGLNSNLDLNGSVTPRVRPRVGEWAPADVPTTGHKRRQRWWTILAAVGVLVVVLAVGTFAYFQLRGY